MHPFPQYLEKQATVIGKYEKYELTKKGFQEEFRFVEQEFLGKNRGVTCYLTGKIHKIRSMTKIRSSEIFEQEKMDIRKFGQRNYFVFLPPNSAPSLHQ